MGEKRQTIKEIAKLAGVSPTAVSFVINGHNGVSDATREKVLSVIKMTGFVPNAASQRLTMKKSFNIALIYPKRASPFSDLYYCEIVSGLTEYLTLAKYNMVFVPLQDDLSSDVPDIIQRQDADGAVFLQSVSSAMLGRLDELTFPYLLIDLHKNESHHTHVSLNCEDVMQLAVQYLLDKGHRRIAFLGSDVVPNYYIRCFTGYQRSMTAAKLTIQPEWLQTGANDQATSAQAIDHLLACTSPPTALCCMSDLSAIHAIKHAQSMGITIPDELSFISVDDILLSRFITPTLTAISYDKPGMGRIAGELLIKKIGGAPVQSKTVDELTVCERESVAVVPY